jgi:hypothetical protein
MNAHTHARINAPGPESLPSCNPTSTTSESWGPSTGAATTAVHPASSSLRLQTTRSSTPRARSCPTWTSQRGTMPFASLRRDRHARRRAWRCAACAYLRGLRSSTRAAPRHRYSPIPQWNEDIGMHWPRRGLWSVREKTSTPVRLRDLRWISFLRETHSCPPPPPCASSCSLPGPCRVMPVQVGRRPRRRQQRV